MDNITKYRIIGLASLLISLLINPQLTIAIVVSIIVFLIIGFGFENSEDYFNAEEVINFDKMTEDEIRENETLSFTIGAMVVMFIVSIYNVIMLF